MSDAKKEKQEKKKAEAMEVSLTPRQRQEIQQRAQAVEAAQASLNAYLTGLLSCHGASDSRVSLARVAEGILIVTETGAAE